jgi:HK97 gp10 family phage protein
MKITLAFDSGADIAKVLDTLADVPRRKASLIALRKAAAPIADAARSHAPRGQGEHLADNINVWTVREYADSDPNDTSVGIGPGKAFFYDFFLEYGWIHHAAMPIYRPAVDGNAVAAFDIMESEYWKALVAASPGGQ